MDDSIDIAYELFMKIVVIGDGKERVGVLRIGISGRIRQRMSCGTVEPCVVWSETRVRKDII